MSVYASGEMTVQTVGYSALVQAKVGQRTYCRSFPLPKDTIIDRVVVDLSDENILTVTAPRKGKGVAINVDSTGDSKSTTSSTRESGADLTSLESEIIPLTLQTAQTSPASTAQERVIHTQVEGAKATATESVKTEAVRRGSSSRIIPLNVEGETASSQTDEGGAHPASAQPEKSKVSSTYERVIPTVIDSGTASSSTTSHTASSQGRVLPIKRRGRFFQDSTFEKVWDDFESAIDELMSRRGSRTGLEDDRFQSYRNLRQCVQQEDNQAATVSKENGEYKIVVDVKDFVDGHLDVKAEEGAIVVTGRKGPCSFERRFSIAGLTQPDKVAASLSADGVLTITSPK